MDHHQHPESSHSLDREQPVPRNNQIRDEPKSLLLQAARG